MIARTESLINAAFSLNNQEKSSAPEAFCSNARVPSLIGEAFSLDGLVSSLSSGISKDIHPLTIHLEQAYGGLFETVIIRNRLPLVYGLVRMGL